MQKTDNYELNLPEAEDFFSIEDFNDNTKKIDEVLESLENPEHDTGKQAEVEELASGESLKVALRKLAKAVADYISHKADKVVHITATERKSWNAKLGTEKIAANLTTDTEGMVLAASMGKNLQEQISTLNSNLSNITEINNNITMVGLGYTKDQNVELFDFYSNIVSGRFNTGDRIKFEYSNTHSASISVDSSSITMNGVTMVIERMPSNSWDIFVALVFTRLGGAYVLTIRFDGSYTSDYTQYIGVLAENQ